MAIKNEKLKKLEEFMKRQGDILKARDMDAFKEMMEDQGLDTSNEKVVEITFYKCAYNRMDMPKELRAEAKEWLNSRGYSEHIY